MPALRPVQEICMSFEAKCRCLRCCWISRVEKGGAAGDSQWALRRVDEQVPTSLLDTSGLIYPKTSSHELRTHEL